MTMSDTPKEKKPNLLARIRQWWYQRQFVKAKKALGIMLEARDPEIYTEMGKAANALARKMCMQWLDNKRINHCRLCPNTDPLVYLDGGYMCAAHAALESRKAEKNSVPLTVVQ